MTVIVNLWGGPGIGKSTTAAGVFSALKQRGINAELVQEYAKELTWQKRYNVLSNQLLVSGTQLQRVADLLDKVPVIVTDSPVLLGAFYDETPGFNEALYNAYHTVINGQRNINVRLQRTKPYEPKGRNQTLGQAVRLDERIQDAIRFQLVAEGGSEDGIAQITNYVCGLPGVK